MNWIYNDGGRAEAGYKNSDSDCTVRAVAIATEQDYKTVHKELSTLNKQSRPKGRTSSRYANTTMKTIKKYMDSLGWKWVATMGIGTGCKVHLNKDELPTGRVVARVSRHLTAVVDGVINDTFDCSRDGLRCVYGYWIKSEVK